MEAAAGRGAATAKDPFVGAASTTYTRETDAPPCPNCGEITVRNGACYKCNNCGTTTGCS